MRGAPEGREDLVESILDVWKGQGSFILYIDSNKSNCYLENLKWVDLGVALRHVEDWVVDWDMDLTPEQKSFVRSHSRYFSNLAKVLFRKTMMCAFCGMLDEERLNKCARCKQTYYCCREHQKAHWKEHKPDCKELRDQRTNAPTTTTSFRRWAFER
jgi:hypothetical protein